MAKVAGAHRCNAFELPSSRRELLARWANGFGAVALAVLCEERGRGATGADEPTRSARLLARRPAFAKQVILLYMDGGPSQVDTFDPKVRLIREHGRPIGIKPPRTQFDNVGAVLAPPWRFRPHGNSGIEISELFPHVGKVADELAVIRSMVADFSEHVSARRFLHTGRGGAGHATTGSWVVYGLGNASQELPGFVVLDSASRAAETSDSFSRAYLPDMCRPSLFSGADVPIDNVQPLEPNTAHQASKLDLLRSLEEHRLRTALDAPQVAEAIKAYEVAARMQTSIPELLDLSNETDATIKLYGIDERETGAYGRQCLLARRLIERGVRFVEIISPKATHDRWDQHSRLREGHEVNARAVDRPIGGLLMDLRNRGLLNETLVIWAGEFGRTPMSQGTDGRDHNPYGFSIWLAGGGIKGGTVYGATDDYGYFAVDKEVRIADLHATILHLLGLDHTKLTTRFAGRDVRLTDVSGEVIHGIIS
jgi:hypothetical protein